MTNRGSALINIHRCQVWVREGLGRRENDNPVWSIVDKLKNINVFNHRAGPLSASIPPPSTRIEKEASVAPGK